MTTEITANTVHPIPALKHWQYPRNIVGLAAEAARWTVDRCTEHLDLLPAGQPFAPKRASLAAAIKRAERYVYCNSKRVSRRAAFRNARQCQNVKEWSHELHWDPGRDAAHAARNAVLCANGAARNEWDVRDKCATAAISCVWRHDSHRANMLMVRWWIRNLMDEARLQGVEHDDADEVELAALAAWVGGHFELACDIIGVPFERCARAQDGQLIGDRLLPQLTMVPSWGMGGRRFSAARPNFQNMPRTLTAAGAILGAKAGRVLSGTGKGAIVGAVLGGIAGAAMASSSQLPKHSPTHAQRAKAAKRHKKAALRSAYGGKKGTT